MNVLIRDAFRNINILKQIEGASVSWDVVKEPFERRD
jgi:hypothetical protein